MAIYLIRRFVIMIATIFVIATLTFILMHSIPGNPFTTQDRSTSEAVQENLNAHYHLDEPMIVQYGIWLKSLATFDFGPSIKQPTETVND